MQVDTSSARRSIASEAISFEVKIKGKPAIVPALRVGDQTIIVTGKWLKVASVHDEEWLDASVLKHPEQYLASIRTANLRADIFTFAQKLPQVEPQYPYYFEKDNVAAIRLTTFDDWWEKQLPQESRKNVRRAGRRGVTVRSVELSDELIRGITAIYNESPIRQGVPFAHYGKGFDTVRRETATLVERSEFLGAYHDNELIGFIKLVYMGDLGSILNIVALNRHYDKRPANALIAKAVEVCLQKGKTHLLYGKYTYGNKTASSLTEFKYRNGFEKILVPRYFIPLTAEGRMCVNLRLHRGLLGILPARLITLLLALRSRCFEHAARRHGRASQIEGSGTEPDVPKPEHESAT
jgi:hypothetical protein